MDKKEYLFKTLSRTKRKDNENYVINAIWHKLSNINIKPVSQQCVIKDNKKHYLVDLYFPQINYAIECHEAHHKKSIEEDKKREMEIKDILNTIKQRKNKIKIQTIKTYDVSIEKLNKEIDKVVSEINKLYKRAKSPKWKIENPVDVCKRNKCISSNDDLLFKTHSDVLELFGYNYKNWQKSTKVIDGNILVWFPKMAIKTEKGYKATHKDWKNIISNDHNFIYEERIGDKKVYEDFRRLDRYVFGKIKNELGEKGYKFLGVYRFDKRRSNRAILRKINDNVEI